MYEHCISCNYSSAKYASHDLNLYWFCSHKGHTIALGLLTDACSISGTAKRYEYKNVTWLYYSVILICILHSLISRTGELTALITIQAKLLACSLCSLTTYSLCTYIYMLFWGSAQVDMQLCQLGVA